MSAYSTYTDQELLAKLRGGDKFAFDEIYTKHWSKVYNQSFKKLHDPELAKDITQEVFIYLWQHRENNLIENLPAYLFTSVRNNVFRALKKQDRFIPVTDLIIEARAFYPDADADLLAKEFFKTYDILVNAMPPAQQRIFRMHYHDDLSTQEIAKILKLSRGTVQNQLTRAVTLLRASLLSIALMISQQ
ncbi:RNA polymerase sigma factor [Pedobacter heparinus]|uniref:RNA polymerase sigma factor, sigma-70 family n=1 Tax=Pedobacter heparinus (strain ATCC 13125 / DSM 2366 / CIP 104194 / JCM 7457 / NBRC 12017 / NCIMB 9290 / NRRL B-14731 / HIM 762-3) TaxID=485917 RepID=C6Y3L0_PEDHD|nr:sigma-70 family RNA polymerase sigma factor [Pedobacter heparinus]ACU03289.1 RNA polymerase sigma factor, sigma-70 family [Pedobacter heparinus DSM 2366]